MRPATMRPENPGPLKVYCKQAELRQKKQSLQTIKRPPVLQNNDESNLMGNVHSVMNSPPVNKSVAQKPTQKKLALPYKMLGKGRIVGPSPVGSSSNVVYKKATGHPYQEYHTKFRPNYNTSPLTNVNNKPKVIEQQNSIYLPSIPSRFAHTFRRSKDSLNTYVTKHIKRDLMVVDNAMKNRLSGTRIRSNPVTSKPPKIDMTRLFRREESAVAAEAIRQQYDYLREQFVPNQRQYKPYRISVNRTQTTAKNELQRQRNETVKQDIYYTSQAPPVLKEIARKKNDETSKDEGEQETEKQKPSESENESVHDDEEEPFQWNDLIDNYKRAQAQKKQRLMDSRPMWITFTGQYTGSERPRKAQDKELNTKSKSSHIDETDTDKDEEERVPSIRKSKTLLVDSSTKPSPRPLFNLNSTKPFYNAIRSLLHRKGLQSAPLTTSAAIRPLHKYTYY